MAFLEYCFKRTHSIWRKTFVFFCFLLLPAWNISIRGGAPVAILNHEVTFKMKPHAEDGESSDGSLMRAWRCLTNSALPASGLVSYEREITSILFKPLLFWVFQLHTARPKYN